LWNRIGGKMRKKGMDRRRVNEVIRQVRAEK